MHDHNFMTVGLRVLVTLLDACDNDTDVSVAAGDFGAELNDRAVRSSCRAIVAVELSAGMCNHH